MTALKADTKDSGTPPAPAKVFCSAFLSVELALALVAAPYSCSSSLRDRRWPASHLHVSFINYKRVCEYVRERVRLHTIAAAACGTSAGWPPTCIVVLCMQCVCVCLCVYTLCVCACVNAGFAAALHGEIMCMRAQPVCFILLY
jgi:hypothetical protein